MNIQDFRAKHPEYGDMSDTDVAQGLHKKFYSDIPFNEFAKKIGVSADPIQAREQSFGEAMYEGLTDPRTAAQGIGAAIGTVAGGGTGFLVPIPGGTIAGGTAGGALGSAIGGQLYDAGKALSNWAEGKDAGQTVAGQTKRAAEDIAFDLFMPEAASRVLSAGKRGIQAALSPVVTGLKGRVGQVGAETVEQIARAQEAGFTPEIGMLGSPEAQQLSQSMRNMPASGKIMAQVDRQNIERGAELADEVAKQYGHPVAADEAGAIVRREAENAESRFFKGAETLFSKVASFVPDNVQATNLNTVVKNALSQGERSAVAGSYLSEATNLAKLAAQDIAEDGTVDKTVLDQIKKMSSAAYKKAPGLRNDSDRFIIQLERAADADLTQAALDAGGKDAAEAVRHAKDWWKMGKGDMRVGDVGLLDDTATIMRQAEDGKVYQWLKAQGKEGDARLERVLGMMDDQAAGDIKATVFHELGRPPAGQRSVIGEDFSFSSFLTNYNKLSDSAKKTLFGKSSKEMESLLEVSEYMKALEKRANFSNTDNMRVWRELLAPISQGIARGGAFGGIPGAMKGATFGVAGQMGQLAVNNRAAQLITDPEFVKWLATTGKKVLVKPTDIAPQIVRLGAIAARNPEKTEDYKAYINALGYDTKMTESKSGKTTFEVK